MVNRKSIRYEYTAPWNDPYLPVLFVDEDGKEIRVGDCVTFRLDGDVSPRSGVIQPDMKIMTFNMVAYEWRYYQIGEEQ